METRELFTELLFNAAGHLALPVVLSKAGKDSVFRNGRMGRYETSPPAGGGRRIWFHAASVGEVNGTVATLRTLKERLPDSHIFLTVGTPQGFRYALDQLPSWVHVLPFPVDLTRVLDRAFDYIRPDLYVAFESEFWPNLFHSLRRRGVPAVLLNGRLSDRSARHYRLLAAVFRPVFDHFSRLAMHSEDDLRNVLSLGVPPERTLILGSSKTDSLPARARPETALRWRSVLRIAPGQHVLVGGSLRRSECTTLMKIFGELGRVNSSLIGIFVPRHLDRIAEMASWLEHRGIPFQRITRIEQGMEERRERVVLVDRIGILFELYSLGDLVFCGGTLEPIGGHNIMEPAAWGKAVFYGPHLQKVLHEHNILHAMRGGFPVRDADDLLQQWRHWLQRLPELERHGECALEALKKLGGVTEKQVEIILAALSENK
ncbi:MAG: glycosyltransferase N-terminal domain-containing protein [Syntrophobacteraceae bacterium]